MVFKITLRLLGAKREKKNGINIMDRNLVGDAMQLSGSDKKFHCHDTADIR